eukprot:UC1_evm1s1493
MDIAATQLESILMHLLEPDAASARIAQGLLSLPPRAAVGYRIAMFRAIVGDDFACALNLPETTLFDRTLARLQIAWFRAYTQTARWPIIGALQLSFHTAVARAAAGASQVTAGVRAVRTLGAIARRLGRDRAAASI